MTTAVPPVGTSAPPQRKHRIFLWVFLAIQAGFILWLVTGIRGAASEDEVVVALLILTLWLVVDAFLGLAYGIYRLARKS